MAVLNPVYTLLVPFLCVFTIPLAIFAGITTTLAFSVLMFRVAIVYVDIALGMVPQYLMGRSGSRVLPATYQYTHARDGLKSPISPVFPSRSNAGSGGQNTPLTATFPTAASFPAPGHRSPRHRSGSVSLSTSGNGFGSNGRRSRRSSQVSMASMGTITPIREGEVTPVMSTSGLLPSVGIDRDFEGVGGWRLDDRGDDGDWTNINSRLELPLERTTSRHHQRTLSGGPVTPGEGGFLMMKSPRKENFVDEKEWEKNHAMWGKSSSISPNSSRLRINQGITVPSALTSLDKEEGYFPPMVSPKMPKKTHA